MGHSVQRPSSSASGKPQKRLELLPEEALYLVEKGALFCWKASRDRPGEDVEWDSASQGSPMSVQQAYAEMIGRQDLTLDRYQVSASPPYLHSLNPTTFQTGFPKSLFRTFAAWVTSSLERSLLPLLIPFLPRTQLHSSHPRLPFSAGCWRRCAHRYAAF